MQFTADELNKILIAHAAWVKGEGGERANLSSANLTGADLTGADLTGAYLSDANLYGAEPVRAPTCPTTCNLYGANLTAYLSAADLSRACTCEPTAPTCTAPTCRAPAKTEAA